MDFTQGDAPVFPRPRPVHGATLRLRQAPTKRGGHGSKAWLLRTCTRRMSLRVQPFARSAHHALSKRTFPSPSLGGAIRSRRTWEGVCVALAACKPSHQFTTKIGPLTL